MNKKNQNDLLIIGVWNFLKVYAYFVVIFTLFRLFFVYYYGDLKLLESHSGDFAQAFYLGWKYDNLVISYLLAPVLLIHFVVSLFQSVKIYNWINYLNRFYFSVMILVVVLLLVCDMGFYNYFQDHINILFYGIIEDDTAALFETLSKNYPLGVAISSLIVFFLFSSWMMIFFLPKMNPTASIFRGGYLKYFFLMGIITVLLLGGLRGGYGELVISPKYSDFSEIEFINQTSLNGIITLENAVKLRRSRTSEDFNLASQMGYGNDIHRAFSDYLGMDVTYTDSTQLINLIKRKTSIKPKEKNTRPHVVVLVMESFGGHWNQYDSDGFHFLGELKNHFQEDSYFPFTISSDNGTIGSLLAIATNIPNRPGARFLSESRYMQLPLESCSHIPFQNSGYRTNFYYGGKLGWRDIGKYFRYQNYDELFGENSIKKQLNLTGKVGTEWGLYDEHLFHAIFDKLDKAKNPQFVLALSTTNHPPFEVPSDYPNKHLVIPANLSSKIAREKDIFLERFKAFEYSNQKLAEFLTRIKNSPLGENTIIAVTGDHNFWGFMNYSKEEAYSKHTVPLYFYIPKHLMPAEEQDYNKVGSHIDIATTLYELALSDVEYLSFGKNLLGKNKTHAFNNNIYADSEGVIFKNQPYKWSTFPLIEKADEGIDFPELRKVYRSTLSISDYYIRSAYNQFKK